MDGLVCGCWRGESEGENERERERLCGFGIKTDRLLMDSSTFRYSDQVLPHDVQHHAQDLKF